MLEIKDLHAGFEGTEIINGISLTVKRGRLTPSWARMVRVKAPWLRFW